MGMIHSKTVDELISELRKMKKQAGGNTEVFIIVPWEDGFMHHAEPIRNVFVADGIVNINVPKPKKG